MSAEASSSSLVKIILEGLQRRGLSQKGLAAHLGISHSQVSRMLSGQRRIQLEEIPKIFEFLGQEVPSDTLPDLFPSGISKYHPTHRVPVVAALAMNVFRKPGFKVMGELAVPAVPDPRVSGLRQYACRLDGPEHGDDVGTFVLCIDYKELRSTPVDNDTVHTVRVLNGMDLEEHRLGRVVVRGSRASVALVGGDAVRADQVELRGLVIARVQLVNF